MPADRGDGFMLDETDRLPWLEPAAPAEDTGAVSARKVALLVLLLLLFVAVMVAAGWWVKNRGDAPADGSVALIEAPGGPYKIPANEAAAKGYDIEGKTFDGTGDETHATSAGSNAMGEIDPSRAPETPVTEMVAAPVAAPPPALTPTPAKQPAKPAAMPSATLAKPAVKGVTSAKIADARTAKPVVKPAPAPTVPAAAVPRQTGPQVQLGAYGSEAIAKAAWSRLVERFADLSGAGYHIEPVLTGGKTLYRLRMTVADAGAGRTLCGRLRVAGERCWAVQ
jgi:cell division septation protein DedD